MLFDSCIVVGCEWPLKELSRFMYGKRLKPFTQHTRHTEKQILKFRIVVLPFSIDRRSVMNSNSNQTECAAIAATKYDCRTFLHSRKKAAGHFQLSFISQMLIDAVQILGVKSKYYYLWSVVVAEHVVVRKILSHAFIAYLSVCIELPLLKELL